MNDLCGAYFHLVLTNLQNTGLNGIQRRTRTRERSASLRHKCYVLDTTKQPFLHGLPVFTFAASVCINLGCKGPGVGLTELTR